MDILNENPRERNLLIHTVTIGIADEIKCKGSISKFDVDKYINHLTDEHGLSNDNSKWVLSVWLNIFQDISINVFQPKDNAELRIKKEVSDKGFTCAATGLRFIHFSPKEMEIGSINYDLYISEKLVTYAGWVELMGEGSDSGCFGLSEYVTNVGIGEITKYISIIKEKTGRFLRLPSEDEFIFIANAVHKNMKNVTMPDASEVHYEWVTEHICVNDDYSIGENSSSGSGIADLLDKSYITGDEKKHCGMNIYRGPIGKSSKIGFRLVFSPEHNLIFDFKLLESIEKNAKTYHELLKCAHAWIELGDNRNALRCINKIFSLINSHNYDSSDIDYMQIAYVARLAGAEDKVRYCEKCHGIRRRGQDDPEKRIFQKSVAFPQVPLRLHFGDDDDLW